MLTESVAIARDLGEVYRAFADLREWKRVLPDVVDVDVLYDDGRHQEFTMTVERPGGHETIRGIRFCEENLRIELVQPKPPPAFRRMVGVWTFTRTALGTEVTAERWFELEDRSAVAKEAARVRLAGYLRANLGRFKAHLEGQP